MRMTKMIMIIAAAAAGMMIVTAVAPVALPTTITTASAQEQQSSEDDDDIVTIVSHRPFKEPMTFPPVQEDFGITGIIGEVRNDSPNTIGEVDVRGKFYDPNGELIHLADGGNAELSVLRPGERAPFFIPINNASVSRSIANYTLSPEIGSSNAINKPAALKVAIGDHGVVEKEEHVAGIVYEIVGTVTNMGNRPTTYVSVIATFYDAAGKIIDFKEVGTHPAHIPPGVTADFIFEDPLGAYGNWTAETNRVVSINVTAESAEYLSVMEPP